MEKGGVRLPCSFRGRYVDEAHPARRPDSASFASIIVDAIDRMGKPGVRVARESVRSATVLTSSGRRSSMTESPATKPTASIP